MKTAFYPCCNTDIEEPLRLLSGYAEKVIFCDINPRLKNRWKRIYQDLVRSDLPTADFVVGDALEVCAQIVAIDVLFYRRDSTGEGGSALFVLGDMFLRPLLLRFPLAGGLIFTDGSNSRGGNFKKMVRPSGLTKHGWKFMLTKDQPYFEQHGLRKVAVVPAGDQLSSNRT